MARDPSILIVGAGPTGLKWLGAALYPGSSTARTDRHRSPRRSIFWKPSDVAARLLANGLKIGGACFHANGQSLGRIDFSVLPRRYNFLLSLPQRDTETVMAARLAEFGICGRMAQYADWPAGNR
ncbi:MULTISPECIES: hypothetical protein [unclassified Mesorhizobium]|uniref:hypothetical protein n=1 Tax=unclassified Mesorhizobium TaxID=325217 RepID=UPI000FCBD183|nr:MULTISPECIES: hypothetical protein [unclassified Mesorhizobium]RUX98088.1 hypothetical protein EN993_01280 [Mesorhizobium sp. M7D.F.Ca.US.004.01.2.1]RVA36693.1 hypothetical protein EN935_01515 [Mesorhizobium sp. M7D.F.Ca.US.004.03.1.1]